METRISFPMQTMEATETLTLLLRTLSEALGIKVGLANPSHVWFREEKCSTWCEQ